MTIQEFYDKRDNLNLQIDTLTKELRELNDIKLFQCKNCNEMWEYRKYILSEDLCYKCYEQVRINKYGEDWGIKI